MNEIQSKENVKVKEKPQKEWLFMVYPPDDEYNYYHYKNGFRAWGDIELGSKMIFLTSIISIIVSIIALIVHYK